MEEKHIKPPTAEPSKLGKTEQSFTSKPTSPTPEANVPNGNKTITPPPVIQPLAKPSPSLNPSQSPSVMAPVSKPSEKSIDNPVEPAATPAVPEKASEGNEVRVLSPQTSKNDAALVTQSFEPVSRWAFWKRARQRDEQLAQISQGYVELVDLVRSIRDQADSQHQNNLILRDSLAHLPEAIKNLEGFGKSHEQVGSALEKIHHQMENYTAKDERLASSMDGFNDTLKGMDDTSKATIQTFDRVQERMRDSDIRMENLFNNVRQSEEKVSDVMVRMQRNMSNMQTFFLLCLLAALGALIYIVLMKKDGKIFQSSQSPPAVSQPSVILPQETTANSATISSETFENESAPEVEAPEVETPEVETPEVETPEVETPEVETPEVETPAPVEEEQNSEESTDVEIEEAITPEETSIIPEEAPPIKVENEVSEEENVSTKGVVQPNTSTVPNFFEILEIEPNPLTKPDVSTPTIEIE